MPGKRSASFDDNPQFTQRIWGDGIEPLNRGRLLRLESFRIRNCFGFVDSGEINLSEPGNLVYFLGRNSSGKTSVLRAISCLEYGQVPAQHPRFENYERSEALSFMWSVFSVNSSDSNTLSVDNLMSEVVKYFVNTPVQIKQDEDGSFASSSATQSAHVTAALLNHAREVYSDLVQRILNGGQVSVAKLGGGTYQFFAEADVTEDISRRRGSVTEHVANTKNAFTIDGFPYPGTLDFDFIEGLLFKQFPEIFFFPVCRPHQRRADRLRGGWQGVLLRPPKRQHQISDRLPRLSGG